MQNSHPKPQVLHARPYFIDDRLACRETIGRGASRNEGPFRCTVLGVIFFLSVLLLTANSFSQDDVVLQHRWEFDPDIGSDWTMKSVRGPKPVDVALLNSKSLQIRVSETRRALYLHSHYGVTNPGEASTALVERLRIGESNRPAMLALVAAAVEFAASKEDMRVLWELTSEVLAARHIVEGSLAKWNCDVGLALWRERVALGQARPNEMLIAIEGIAAVGSASDRNLLEGVLHSDRALETAKVAAAKSLGRLVKAGLEPKAREVLDSDSEQREIMAAHLLAEHSSAAAQEMRIELMDRQNQFAQLVAYQAMVQHAPAVARKLAETLIAHPDSSMRRVSISVLDQSQDLASLNIQAGALVDRVPSIRQRVRANLERKAANPDLREAVREIITAHLGGTRYEGTEQAILLAVALEEHDRSPMFVQLLKHSRPEVHIRAAWALQRFPLTTDVLQDILAFCELGTDRIDKNQLVSFEEVVALGFLFEALGLHAHAPANDMLMKYVPKDDHRMRDPTRASAIYALGHIWKDSKNSQLSQQLMQRLLDEDPIIMEDDTVKYVSAIAAGRIGDKSALKGLQGFAESPTYPIGKACHWSVDHLNQLAD